MARSSSDIPVEMAVPESCPTPAAPLGEANLPVVRAPSPPGLEESTPGGDAIPAAPSTDGSSSSRKRHRDAKKKRDDDAKKARRATKKANEKKAKKKAKEVIRPALL